jgi:hypothetical protein
MLQSSDECIADALTWVTPTPNTPLSTYDDATVQCVSKTFMGDTTVLDYSACDMSLLTEACTADNRKFELNAIIILYHTHLHLI